MKETIQTGKLNALWDQVLDQKKDINGMTGKIQVRFIDQLIFYMNVNVLASVTGLMKDVKIKGSQVRGTWKHYGILQFFWKSKILSN